MVVWWSGGKMLRDCVEVSGGQNLASSTTAHLESRGWQVLVQGSHLGLESWPTCQRFALGRRQRSARGKEASDRSLTASAT